jgi:hypothetical protein
MPAISSDKLIAHDFKSQALSFRTGGFGDAELSRPEVGSPPKELLETILLIIERKKPFRSGD